MLPWHSEKGKVTVVGICYEGHVTGVPGSKLAPPAVKAAANLIESYSPYAKTDVQGVVRDLGDIEPAHNLPDALEDIESLLHGIRLPIALGGSHTITLGIIHALNPKRIVYIDAHLDLREEYMGERYSHACVARRLIEEGVDLIFIGARSGSQEEWAYTKDIDVYPPGEWPKIRGKTYISVDIDAFDPAYAPGVGTPVPGGINPRDFFLWLASQKIKLVGADVVETNPLIENHITPILSATILRELIAKVVRGKHL